MKRKEEISEKLKREMEMKAKNGNLFAKSMVESWAKDKKQQSKEIGEGWFGILTGIIAVIAIFAIFGVIILAVIKWAFTTLFGS